VSEESLVHQGYDRLLRQQLRKGETIDGIFASGPTRSVAITSERLIVVTSSDHAGWELKAIPWGLLTEVAFDASEGEDPTGVTIRLHYDAPNRASVRKAAAPRDVEAGAEGEAPPEPSVPTNELDVVVPKKSAKMAAALRARLASVNVPAPSEP